MTTINEIRVMLREQAKERSYQNQFENKLQGRLVSSLGRSAQKLHQYDNPIANTLGDYVSNAAKLGEKGIYSLADFQSRNAYGGIDSIEESFKDLKESLTDLGVESSLLDRFSKVENQVHTYANIMDAYVETLASYGKEAAADEDLQNEVMRSLIPTKEQYVTLFDETRQAIGDMFGIIGDVPFQDTKIKLIMKPTMWTAKKLATNSVLQKRNIEYITREADRIYGA